MMAHRSAQVVMPELPPEKTAVESLRDLMQAARGGNAQVDAFDKVTCVNVQHIRFAPDQPLVTAVLIGYSNGYQVWVFPSDSGAARELVSVRNGKYTHSIRLLATPSRCLPNTVDRFTEKRPLMAVCCDAINNDRREQKARPAKTPNGSASSVVSSSVAAPRCVEIVSLRTGEQLERLAIATGDVMVENLLSSENWLAVVHVGGLSSPTLSSSSSNFSTGQNSSNSSASTTISVFDASSLRLVVRMRVGGSPAAVALGDRWLAFADRRLRPAIASLGGVTNGPASGTYVSAALDATKTLLRGIAVFSESVASWKTSAPQCAILAAAKSPTSGQLSNGDSQNQRNANGCSTTASDQDTQECPYGVVSVVDLEQLAVLSGTLEDHDVSNVLLDGFATVAHFVAHADETVQRLTFDPSGSLLLTSGASGRSFHIFTIHAAISASQRSAVHHLYVLRRGNTECMLQDVSFTADSRFVTATSSRGTVHLFAVAPYGGAPTMRTHASSRVVNRTSQFQRSAGLDELVSDEAMTPIARVTNLLNSRRPPFPTPTELAAATQLHHNALMPFSVGVSLADAPPSSTPVSVAFGAPISEEMPANSSSLRALSAIQSPNYVETLLSLNGAAGTLTQYDIIVESLSANANASSQQLAATNDASINVRLTPRVVWPLRRSAASSELPFSTVVASKPMKTSASSSSLSALRTTNSKRLAMDDDAEWMAQVEIVTYQGPHRRLWMGPQFTFCTYEPSARASALSSSHSPPDSLTLHASSSSCVLQTLVGRDSAIPTPSQTRSSPIEISGSCERERGRQRGGAIRIEACSIGSTASPNGVTYERVGACCEHDEAVRTCVGEVDESRLRMTLEDALLETAGHHNHNGDSSSSRHTNMARGASLPIPVGVAARRGNAIELELCLEPVSSSSGCADKTSSSSEAEQNLSWSSASSALDAAMSNSNATRVTYRNYSEHSMQSSGFNGHVNMSP